MDGIILTFDESWFYFARDHEHIQLHQEEHPPETPRHTIEDPKMMVMIAWNPLGFHLLGCLPKGQIFNAEYYRANILSALLPPAQRLMGENS
jgi:hypothetical protein